MCVDTPVSWSQINNLNVKKMKTLIMILAAMTILNFSANAQFNGIKNAKDKVTN